MGKRWVGLSASTDEVTLVDVEVHGESVTLKNDQTIKVQEGERAPAYKILHQRVADYLRDNEVSRVVIKASALPQAGKPKLGLLHSAEVRGVVAAAAAFACDTALRAKANTSRSFGKRKVDEYAKDDAFWSTAMSGTIRKQSREIAVLLLAAIQEEQ